MHQLFRLIFFFLCISIFTARAANSQVDAFAVETSCYVHNLEERVSKVWRPSKESNWESLIVECKIGASGSVLALKLKQSSGSHDVDQLAMQSVEEAAPFEKLPVGVSSALFDLHFRQLLLKAPSATSRVKADIGADLDYGPYLSELQDRIRKVWAIVPQTKPKCAVVIFENPEDGQFVNLRMASSSNDAAYDRAVLDAVSSVAPLMKRPQGADDRLSIQFTFKQSIELGASKTGKAWDAWIDCGS